MTTPVTSTDLGDLVEALKRELAVPGEFASEFPDTTDDDLAAKLADAAAEAQLDGFFGTSVIDADNDTITPAVSSGGQALLVLYASISVIRAQLRNLQTTVTYKAGPVEYTAIQSANVLTALLNDLVQRKTQLLQQVLRAGRAGNAVYVGDGYLTRAVTALPWGAGYLYDSELLGVGSCDLGLLGW